MSFKNVKDCLHEQENDLNVCVIHTPLAKGEPEALY